MKIRRAKPKDLKKIVELFELYLAFYKKDLNHKRCQKFLAQRLKKADSIIFVVVAADQKNLLGFLQMYPTFSSLNQKPAWILNDLYIRESARGKSLGKKLLHAAQKHSEKTGANSL